MTSKTLRRLAFASVSALALMTTVLADQAWAQAPADTSNDEIIVTARKRGEALLDLRTSGPFRGKGELRQAKRQQKLSCALEPRHCCWHGSPHVKFQTYHLEYQFRTIAPRPC